MPLGRLQTGQTAQTHRAAQNQPPVPAPRRGNFAGRVVQMFRPSAQNPQPQAQGANVLHEAQRQISAGQSQRPSPQNSPTGSFPSSHPLQQPASPRPVWTPQAAYGPGQISEIRPHMQAYAKFLCKNPDQIPHDMHAAIGPDTNFATVMRALMLKHFPHLSQRTTSGKDAAPPWTPQGTYPKTEFKSYAPRIQQYARFLDANPHQMPPDIKAKVDPRQPFASLLGAIVQKHFPEHAAAIQTRQADFFILPKTSNGERTYHAAQTPTPQPPGKPFYHENQRVGTGYCGMHAFNAFCGGPMISTQEFQNALIDLIQKETGMTPDMIKDLGLHDDGSDPGLLQHLCRQFSAQDKLSPKAANTKLETGIRSPRPAERQAFVSHCNSFKGDRAIVGYSRSGIKHFVALRRNSENQWSLVDSSRSHQENNVNLGEFIANHDGAHVLHLEDGFSFK